MAVEVLIWRYGTMVLNLCRRILHDEHQAEDAFQAAFLVFVRNARSISKRESVGHWLYKVAFRVAHRMRAKLAKQPERRAEFDEFTGREPANDLIWRDLRPVLDEEIAQLPEKYRAPIVLRYLQGLTNEETAEHLGCPKGAVRFRLARRAGTAEVQSQPAWAGTAGRLVGHVSVREYVVGCSTDGACRLYRQSRNRVRGREIGPGTRVEFRRRSYTRSFARYVHHQVDQSNRRRGRCRGSGPGSPIRCPVGGGRFSLKPSYRPCSGRLWTPAECGRVGPGSGQEAGQQRHRPGHRGRV